MKEQINGIPITHDNGILNLNYFRELEKERAKKSPEQIAAEDRAIIRRNDALAQVPFEQRRDWVKTHPLKMFMD